MAVTKQSQKSLIYLVIFTALAAVSCFLFGYLTLPLAAGLYSSVLLYEKSTRRVASYILPVFTFVLNFFINGIFSLEGGAYVALGVIIYFCFVKERSKAETSFYTSLATFLLVTLSLVLLAFDEMGVARVSAISDFYRRIYMDLRNEFLSFVMDIIQTDSLGVNYFAFNIYEANALFMDIIILTIPTLMILSFFIAGLSIKLFDVFKSKSAPSFTRDNEWSFSTPTPTAVFFIVISFLASVTAGNSILELSVRILYFFFFILFLYLGIKSTFGFLSRRFSSSFSILIILSAYFLLSSAILQILSYVGAIANIVNNRSKSLK